MSDGKDAQQRPGASQGNAGNPGGPQGEGAMKMEETEMGYVERDQVNDQEQLQRFLNQMDDYTPTVCNARRRACARAWGACSNCDTPLLLPVHRMLALVHRSKFSQSFSCKWEVCDATCSVAAVSRWKGGGGCAGLKPRTSSSSPPFLYFASDPRRGHQLLPPDSRL